MYILKALIITGFAWPYKMIQYMKESECMKQLQNVNNFYCAKKCKLQHSKNRT